MYNETLNELETKVWLVSDRPTLMSTDYQMMKLDLLMEILLKFEIPMNKKYVREYGLMAFTNGFSVMQVANYLLDYYGGRLEKKQSIHDYVYNLQNN